MHGIPSNVYIGKQSISQNPPDRCENWIFPVSYNVKGNAGTSQGYILEEEHCVKTRAATIATWETVIIKIRGGTVLIRMSKGKGIFPEYFRCLRWKYVQEISWYFTLTTMEEQCPDRGDKLWLQSTAQQSTLAALTPNLSISAWIR